MSVRVNLLPQATRERDRAARQRVLAVVLLLVLLVGLGGATFWQRGQLGAAEDELADAQAELTLAQAEVAELAEFAELEQRLAEANDAIVAALADQGTLTGVLQDFSLVMPDDAALLTLNVTFDQDSDGRTIGTLRATGETLGRIAPGVERLLLSLDRVAGLTDVYLATAAIDDDEITTFNLDAQIGAEYYTHRFEAGIPEVLR